MAGLPAAEEPPEPSDAPGPTRLGLLRVLALLGAGYTLLAYGFLGFGVILLATPGFLVLISSSPSGPAAAALATLILSGLAIVAGILGAVLLVHRPIRAGDQESARLPALGMALGNIVVAMVGGLWPSNLLVVLGGLGAVIFLSTFLTIEPPADPPDERISLA